MNRANYPLGKAFRSSESRLLQSQIYRSETREDSARETETVRALGGMTTATLDQEISLQELFTRAAVAYLKTMPKKPNEAARGVK